MGSGTTLHECITPGDLSRRDIMFMIKTPGELQEDLYELADRVRNFYMGGEVHLRGIIEFSNHCRMNCFYCGLRQSNKRVKRYRMTPEKIIETARYAARLGLKTIVLQSGEDPAYGADELSKIIRKIRSEMDLVVALSLGERPWHELQKLRKAGAERYLLKHETADEKLFASLRPGTSLAVRIKHLYLLKELGYQVGSGNIVGLPGQSVESIADDIELMRDLKVEMAGIGPFIPHPDTPLGNFPAGSLSLTLKALSVARLAMPRVLLPATTAVATIHMEGRRLALACGANVVMPDVTPLEFQTHYEIYPGKSGTFKDTVKTLENIKETIYSMGREIGKGYGNAPGFA